MSNIYFNKYLKYKKKYLELLSSLKGGKSSNCGVDGCPYCKPGQQHSCRNCGMCPSDHFTRNCQVFGLVYIEDGNEILTQIMGSKFDLFRASVSPINDANAIQSFTQVINHNLRGEKTRLYVKNLVIMTSYMIPRVGKVYIFKLDTDNGIPRGANGTSTYNLMVFDDGATIAGNPAGNYGEEKLRYTLAHIRGLGQTYTDILARHGVSNNIMGM